MHLSRSRILQEQEAARDRRPDRPLLAQPASALPRRLQACMQELLNVNERYHELLQAAESQKTALEAAHAEIAQLRPALESAEVKIAAQQQALQRAEATVQDTRAAHELQTVRCNAAEAERAELHKVIKAYAARLLESETQLSATTQRNAEAEAWLATHWEAGFEEGQKQQQKEARGKMQRAQQQATARASAAFEKGKQQSAAAHTSRITREQAERRLLLHRAEEARQQQQHLAKELQGEKQARQTAEARQIALDERLKGVRSHKKTLQEELETSRAAHKADLQHFDQMESALGVACAEYSSLAVKHARGTEVRARSPPRSPPRAAAAAPADVRFGSSPPEAMRMRPPRPSDTGAEPSASACASALPAEAHAATNAAKDASAEPIAPRGASVSAEPVGSRRQEYAAPHYAHLQ